jgi:hypothetical protein
MIRLNVATRYLLATKGPCDEAPIANMIAEGGPAGPTSYPSDRMRHCRKHALSQARLRKANNQPRAVVAEWVGYARYWHYRLRGRTHDAAKAASGVAAKAASPSNAGQFVPMANVTGGVA